MESAPNHAFYESLPAAMPQLSEKPHQGVPSSNPALYLGHEICKSTTVLGLRAALHLERIRSRYTIQEPGYAEPVGSPQAGSFTGYYDGVSFTVDADTMLPSTTLTLIHASSPLGMQYPLVPGEVVGGLTSEGNPYSTWVAYDLPLETQQRTQIYELGNALGFITNTATYTFDTSDTSSNNEPGKSLQGCMDAQQGNDYGSMNPPLPSDPGDQPAVSVGRSRRF